MVQNVFKFQIKIKKSLKKKCSKPKAKALALKDPEAKKKMQDMGINIWNDEENNVDKCTIDGEEKTVGVGAVGVEKTE